MEPFPKHGQNRAAHAHTNRACARAIRKHTRDLGSTQRLTMTAANPVKSPVVQLEAHEGAPDITVQEGVYLTARARGHHVRLAVVGQIRAATVAIHEVCSRTRLTGDTQ